MSILNAKKTILEAKKAVLEAKRPILEANMEADLFIYRLFGEVGGMAEALGKASFPPMPFKKWFPSTLPGFQKNWGWVPWVSLWISYGPFVGLPCLGCLWAIVYLVVCNSVLAFHVP